eukprot:5174704-Pleurochrysis_carterae.AAC.1
MHLDGISPKPRQFLETRPSAFDPEEHVYGMREGLEAIRLALTRLSRLLPMTNFAFAPCSQSDDERFVKSQSPRGRARSRSAASLSRDRAWQKCMHAAIAQFKDLEKLNKQARNLFYAFRTVAYGRGDGDDVDDDSVALVTKLVVGGDVDASDMEVMHAHECMGS